jgi:hypothetical protein
LTGRRFCDVTGIMKNATEDWKAFTKWLPEMFPAPLQSLVEVYSSTRGPFWRKCSSNDCAVLYFSEMKWCRDHFEAATYKYNNWIKTPA